jgi:hypothetical protein
MPAQKPLAPPDSLTPVEVVDVADDVPLTTIGMYAGTWSLHHHAGPRAEGHLYRATRAFVPAVRP